MPVLDSIRKEILGLNHYAEGKLPLKSRVDKKLKLSSNENMIGTSQDVLKAINEELNNGLSIYPDSKMTALRKSIVDYWRKQGIIIKAENLLFGDASGEVLNMLISAFVREKDAVIISEKSFTLYSLLSIPKGADVIEVKRKDFRVDLEGIVDAVINAENPKMVIIANPDNPTSTYHSMKEIEVFLRKIPEQTAILIDEAYIHFAGIENSVIKLRERYPNLIVVYTFSKVYGLAGLRVGYAVLDEQVANQVEKIRLPFNLGRLQQAGAKAAIEDDEFVQKTVKIINEGRDFLEKGFDSLGIWHLKSFGNFIFADLGERSSGILEYLEENGISLRTLTSFGFTADYVRITIGRPEDNEYLLEKLREAMAD